MHSVSGIQSKRVVGGFTPVMIVRALACISLFAAIDGARAESITHVWRNAAQRSGVPVRILHGIALAESGKKWADGTFRPWPWTLNSPARGSQFFKTRAAAALELERILKSGATNVDIGWMQVNCGYHCSRVSDPVDLLDPETNLRVAADILREVRQTKGELAGAVGAYHAGLRPSRAARSQRYQSIVARHVRKLAEAGV